jgi:1-acyl-sn-glycerol-3-phosphate acyltransferase
MTLRAQEPDFQTTLADRWIADRSDDSLHQRWQRFPREPGLACRMLQRASALFTKAYLRVYHRLEIVGRENLPLDRSFVMVANHASHLDALCLLSALPGDRLHQAYPAAAADYFFKNVRRTALSVLLVNALPFHRDRQMHQSLELCRELLNGLGNILILFPEGTRSQTGEIKPFKHGIGKLLAGSDVPVVPCYLEGTFRALRKGAWLPRPRRVRLVIGVSQSFRHLDESRESIERVCRQLSDSIYGLRATQSQHPMYGTLAFNVQHLNG